MITTLLEARKTAEENKINNTKQTFLFRHEGNWFNARWIDPHLGVFIVPNITEKACFYSNQFSLNTEAMVLED